MSTAPFRVDDGRWKDRLEIKSGYRFPFSDRGDLASFEYVSVERFDKGTLPRRNSMDAKKTALGTAYLVEAGAMDDQGDNIFEQECVYASIPATRFEGASLNYTLQWYRATFGNAQEHGFPYPVNFELAELTFPASVRVKYEYFANTVPQPLIKPRLATVFELLYSLGGKPATSGELVAEDSEVSIYKGKIYQRRTPYVTITPRAVVT